jgi:hypothetical protein
LLDLQEFGVLTFPATAHALKAERTLKGGERAFVTIPTPREISRSCGIALKVWPQEAEAVRQYLQERGVEVEAVYLVARDGREVKVLRLDDGAGAHSGGGGARGGGEKSGED